MYTYIDTPIYPTYPTMSIKFNHSIKNLHELVHRNTDFEKLHIALDDAFQEVLTHLVETDEMDDDAVKTLKNRSKKLIQLRNKYKESFWYA